MRQRRWLELLKNYTLDIKYQARKANVVADTLSRKPRGALEFLAALSPHLLNEMEKLQIEVILPGDSSSLATLQITLSIVNRIKEGQQEDPKLLRLSKKVEEGSIQDFTLKEGVLRFKDRLCVPKNAEWRKELLKESHGSTPSNHPGSTSDLNS